VTLSQPPAVGCHYFVPGLRSPAEEPHCPSISTKCEEVEEVVSPAIVSCPGGQDTVAGEKDVVDGEVVGELEVIIAVVVLWVTTSGLSWGGDG